MGLKFLTHLRASWQSGDTVAHLYHASTFGVFLLNAGITAICGYMIGQLYGASATPPTQLDLLMGTGCVGLFLAFFSGIYTLERGLRRANKLVLAVDLVLTVAFACVVAYAAKAVTLSTCPKLDKRATKSRLYPSYRNVQVSWGTICNLDFAFCHLSKTAWAFALICIVLYVMNFVVAWISGGRAVRHKRTAAYPGY